MAFQMILVISSPSSSATGLATLIFPVYMRKILVVNRYAKIEFINKNLSQTLTISDEDKIYFLLLFCVNSH